jgi:predicted RecA/RadA family phage recombinase
MKNEVSFGTTKSFTAGADTVSGQAVVNGVLLGVAVGNTATGDVGTLQIEGVFELPKNAAAVIGDGDSLTWDVSANGFGTGVPAAGDLVGCAIAMAPAGAGSATVIARLAPGSGLITA